MKFSARSIPPSPRTEIGSGYLSLGKRLTTRTEDTTLDLTGDLLGQLPFMAVTDDRRRVPHLIPVPTR